MGTQNFTIRLATRQDIVKVNEVFKTRKPSLQATFGRFDYGNLSEICLYSVAAIDNGQGLIGLAIFDDVPAVPGNVAQSSELEVSEWAIQCALDLGYMRENIIWLRVCVALSTNKEQETMVLKALLQAVATVSPNTQVILHTSPLDQHVLPEIFKPMTKSQKYRIMISSCLRSNIFPPLQVRRAKVEDYDDLLPIIRHAQQQNYPLSRVPRIADPLKEYSIARLIAAQDVHNSVLVATADGKLVGIMACSALVDFEPYQLKFNVDIYEQLATLKAQQAKLVSSSTKNQDDLQTEPQPTKVGAELPGASVEEPKKTKPKGIPQKQAKLTPAQQREEEEKLKQEASMVEAKKKAQEEKLLKELEEKRIQDEKLQKELQARKKEEEEKHRILAEKRRISLLNKQVFVITLVCIQEQFESRVIDFLEAAFKLEKKEFGLVELPYTSIFLPMLHYFTRVSLRNACKQQAPDVSTSNPAIYLMHKGAVSSGFEVRPAKSVDATGVGELVESFQDCRGLVEAIHYPKEGCINMVATLSTQIVGYAMLEEAVPVDALCSHFNISDFLNLEDHAPSSSHAIVILFVMNPIFKHKRRFFLREIMQQTGKSVLYYPMFPNQELPDVLDDLLLLSGRQHEQMEPCCTWGKIPIKSTRALSHTDQLPRPQRKTSIAAGVGVLAGAPEQRPSRLVRGQFQGFDCALYFTTHKLICQYRAVVTAQVVVVGASRTAAACLHRLLADRDLQFTNLTLISPKGLQGLSSSVSSSFDMDPGPGASLAKLGLDCQVNVITASVVHVDRQNRYVTLSTGCYFQYDYLVITTGLQDQTKFKVKLEAKDSRYILRPEDLAVLQSTLGGEDKLGCDGELVVVYGFSLEAFNVIHMLLNRGVEGKSIIMICPETKTLLELGASCFGDESIAKIVLGQMERAGVVCKTNWQLTSIQLTEGNGKLENLTFVSIVKKEEPMSDTEDDVISRSSRSTKSSVSTTPEGPPPEIYIQPCTMLVTCDKRHVDYPLFQAINKANIIYDGRIVVDGKFQTVDSQILAAGSVSKFSRHCGDLPKLENNNSIEMGEALASSIILMFAHHIPSPAIICPTLQASSSRPTQESTESPSKWPTSSAPTISLGRGVGGLLPGGLWYFCIALPRCCLRRWDVDKCETSLVSEVGGCFFRLDVLATNEVGRIVSCGAKRIDAWKMVRIVGLSEYLLSMLVKRDPPPDNVAQSLLQPWAAALFHDKFLPFHNRLLAELASQDDKDRRTVARIVRQEFLAFIKQHKRDFPMYSDH